MRIVYRRRGWPGLFSVDDDGGGGGDVLLPSASSASSASSSYKIDRVLSYGRSSDDGFVAEASPPVWSAAWRATPRVVVKLASSPLEPLAALAALDVGGVVRLYELSVVTTGDSGKDRKSVV